MDNHAPPAADAPAAAPSPPRLWRYVVGGGLVNTPLFVFITSGIMGHGDTDFFAGLFVIALFASVLFPPLGAALLAFAAALVGAAAAVGCVTGCLVGALVYNGVYHQRLAARVTAPAAAWWAGAAVLWGGGVVAVYLIQK